MINTTNIRFLVGSLVVMEGILGIKPLLAQDSPPPPPFHDPSTPSIPIRDSPVDNAVPGTNIPGASVDSNGNIILDPESLGANGDNTNGTGGNAGFTLSPEIIQAINEAAIISSGNQSGTNGSSLETGNSDAIAICLSDPCIPAAEGTKGITLQELAKLLEEDLQNSLGNLAELEQQQDLADAKPRRFSRRRTVCDCGNSLVRAREEVKEKTAQYQEIIDLADQLNPQNNKW